MPEISVILPFKNAEAFLKDSIQSILDQDLQDWELLLVDNGSTDRGKEIAKDFEGKEERIIYLDFPHGGVASAFNFGFKKSNADVVARMDADDIAFPTRFSEQFKLLGKSGTETLAYSPVKPLGKARIGWLRYLVWQNSMQDPMKISQNRFVEMPVSNPTLMAKRQTLIKTGLYREDLYPEDYELFLRAVEKGLKVEKTSSAQLYWRDHENRLTWKHEGYSRENFFRVKAPYLFRQSEKLNPKHPEIAIWGTGKIARKYIDILEETGFRPKAFYDLKEASFRKGTIRSYKKINKEYFLISLVSNRGAGERIRQFLVDLEFNPDMDFLIAG